MSLKELSIFTSIFCTVQVFVTKLPFASVILNCTFCVPIDKYSVISKEFSPATAVFVATILPPTFQVAVPSVIGSSEESVPENSYLIITLSLTVATIGEVVIYLILSILLVLLPPLPPTIVNFFLGSFFSLSAPSFSISYKTNTFSPTSGSSVSLYATSYVFLGEVSIPLTVVCKSVTVLLRDEIFVVFVSIEDVNVLIEDSTSVFVA